MVSRSLRFVLAALTLATPVLAASEPRPVDLLVTGGVVVTLDAGRRVLDPGAVAVASGRIVAVGPAAEVAAAVAPAARIDARGTTVMPGLVNAHSHAPMVLFRGLADDLTLEEWLEEHVFPAEKRFVDAEFVRVGTRLAAIEMLLSGTTTFADMYYFEDQVAEAAAEAGLRAVAGETLIDFPAPDHPDMGAALAWTEGFLARWQDHPLIVPAVAPHSVYLTDRATLRAARELADRYAAPLLIHLSETRWEQQRVRDRYAATPTEVLEQEGFLRSGVLVAHGVYLSAADRAALRAAGAGVAHCPQSNMKTAAGVAPVREMLAEGLALGLGTDGAASNNDLDMFEEMRTAAFMAKNATGDPTVASAAEVLEAATLGGARALGLSDRIGSLEVGKRADLVVVSREAPHQRPLYDPVSHLVYVTRAADVRDVVIEGRVVVRDRDVLTLDVQAALRDADRFRAAIAASR